MKLFKTILSVMTIAAIMATGCNITHKIEDTTKEFEKDTNIDHTLEIESTENNIESPIKDDY